MEQEEIEKMDIWIEDHKCAEPDCFYRNFGGYIYCSFHMYGLSKIPQNVIDYIISKESKKIMEGYKTAKSERKRFK